MPRILLGNGDVAPPSSISALVSNEWSASHLGRFTLQEGSPGTYRTVGRMRTGAGLDAVE
jgi:hypothetical protein